MKLLIIYIFIFAACHQNPKELSMKSLENIQMDIPTQKNTQVVEKAQHNKEDYKAFYMTPENSNVKLLFTLSPFHVMKLRIH